MQQNFLQRGAQLLGMTGVNWGDFVMMFYFSGKKCLESIIQIKTNSKRKWAFKFFWKWEKLAEIWKDGEASADNSLQNFFSLIYNEREGEGNNEITLNMRVGIYMKA